MLGNHKKVLYGNLNLLLKPIPHLFPQGEANQTEERPIVSLSKWQHHLDEEYYSDLYLANLVVVFSTKVQDEEEQESITN